MIPKKYTKILFICLMSFSMSLIMTLIITYINTGFDEMYYIRFFKAWSISLPVALVAISLVAPMVQKIVDKVIK